MSKSKNNTNKEPIFHIKKKETSSLVDNLFSNANIPNDIVAKQNWEELNDLYFTVAQSIVIVGENINESIKTINSIGMSDNKELIVSIDGLRRDIESFTSDLIKIKKRHEGKTGVINDGDDLALCFSIFNDYIILNDRFKAIVFPVVLTVTEHLAEAVDTYKANQALLNTPATIEGEVINTVKEDTNV